MKTRRRTIESRTVLTNNEGFDAVISTPSTQSLTTTSATNTESIPITLKSDVWQHFERCNNAGSLTAKCLLCQTQLLTPNYGTSTLRRHLIQRHGLKEFAPSDEPPAPVVHANLSRSEKKKLDYLATNAIIQDARAFGDLQKPGIQKFINALLPGKIYFLIVPAK